MRARRLDVFVAFVLLVAVNGFAAGVWLAGCDDEPDRPNPVGGAAVVDDAGDASDGFDGNTCVIVDASTLDAAAVAEGLALIKTHKCFDCHGDGLSGNNAGVTYAPDEGGVAYPPNLTPDPVTGIGCWTRAQIVTAILAGTDTMGEPLCPPMPVFGDAGALSLDEAQAAAVAEFLESLAPVVNDVADTVCATPDAGE